jgi:hypothetical protein
LDLRRFSAGRERERRHSFLGGLVVRRVAAVRAAGAALLGAGTKRFFDDRLDGASAAAAFGAAAEATVNLLGIPRQVRSCADSITDIVVAQDVAGTDDHETGRTFDDAAASSTYLSARRDAKGKASISSNSKLMRDAHWNESKEACCGGSNYRFGSAGEIFKRLVASTAAVTTAAVASGIAIRRGTVATERGEDAPNVTVTAAGAAEAVATVSARALTPCAAVPCLCPAHQEIGDQRRSADRCHECRQPVGHQRSLPKAARRACSRRNIADHPAIIGDQIRRVRSLII